MTDQELWKSLKQGSKEALEHIYSGHAAVLLKYGYKFSKDEQLVEDCVQDLFIELWKNKAGLSDTDSIARYLFVALRRKVIRQIDRSKKHVAADEPQEYQFDAVLSIDESIIASETKAEWSEALKTAMENLSSRQREIIYLKYFNGMDNQAICEIMDINYQSVRNLLSRTLKSLKDKLGLWWGLLIYFFLK